MASYTALVPVLVICSLIGINAETPKAEKREILNTAEAAYPPGYYPGHAGYGGYGYVAQPYKPYVSYPYHVAGYSHYPYPTYQYPAIPYSAHNPGYYPQQQYPYKGYNPPKTAEKKSEEEDTSDE